MLQIQSSFRSQRWLLAATASTICLAGISSAAPQFQLEGRRPLTDVRGAATSPQLIDVNGDGALDALFVSRARSGVSVALGDGNGNLGNPTSIASSFGPVLRFVTGDLEGDGDVDIVAVTSGLYVRIANDGAGNFSVQQSFGVPEAIQKLILVDLTGDGLAELLVQRGVGALPNTVAFLVGEAQGFAPQFVPAGSEVQTLDAVDVDGDGPVDLVFGMGNEIRVASNLGGGVFSSPGLLQTVGGQTPLRLHGASDVDRDGATDFFALLSPGQNAFFKGLGGGSFADGQLLGSSNGQSSTPAPLLIDLDGDSDVDLLQFEGPFFAPSTAVVYLQASPGVFQPGIDTGIVDAYFAPGDLNGDGLDDLLRTNFNGELSWLLGNGNAASQYFDAQRMLVSPALMGYSALSVHDLDGDSDDDVLFIAEDAGQVGWIENVAPGVTAQPAVFIGRDLDILSVESIDFEGDGDLDLVLHEVDFTQSTRGFSVWLNDGSENFVLGPVETLPLANGFAELVARDLDGDGDGDIILSAPEAGRIGVVPTVYTNRGAGVPFRVTSPFGTSIVARQVDTGDFNADGRIDLIFARLFNNGLYELVVLPAFGLGAFSPPVTISTLVDGFDLQVIDFDGDGMEDLLMDDPNLGVALWRRTGVLQFESPMSLMANNLFQGFQVLDFDGDGDQDLAISRSGGVRLAAQDATGTLGDAFRLAMEPLALPLQLADLDGDGDGDLVEIDTDLDGVFAYENTGRLAIGSAFCFQQSSPLAAIGSAVALDNNITLRAQGVPPGQFGIAVASRTFGPQNPVPGGVNFCLTGAVGRFDDPAQILMSDPGGVMSLQLDLGALSVPSGTVPGIAGQTWCFQIWHRRPAPGPLSAFTSGVSVELQ